MGVFVKIKQSLVLFWRALTPEGIKCVNCNRELTDDASGFCVKCLNELPFIGFNICEKCGVKIGGESRFCERCGNNRHNFDACRSACEFRRSARHLTHRLKFGGERFVAKPMAYCMAEVFKNLDWQIDAVIFIPMTKIAEKKRGFNQARLLAEKFCAIIPLPLMTDIVKVKETSRQASLNFKERMENIKNAYEITDKAAFKGKNILIIDDVKTTGATLDETARALKKSGAVKVYGLTFASRAQQADLD